MLALSITVFGVFFTPHMITQLQALNFIQCARFNRISQNDLLREENAELLRIIADFDTRLAEVEAERDDLKRKISGYHCTARSFKIARESIFT